MNRIELYKEGDGRSKQEDHIQSGADKLTVKGTGINICFTFIVCQVFVPPNRSISRIFIPPLQMKNLSFSQKSRKVRAESVVGSEKHLPLKLGARRDREKQQFSGITGA